MLGAIIGDIVGSAMRVGICKLYFPTLLSWSMHELHVF